MLALAMTDPISGPYRLLVSAFLAGLLTATAAGQSVIWHLPSSPQPDFTRAAVVPLGLLLQPSTLEISSSPSSRIRLLGIQPGFLSELSWLDQPDPQQPGEPDPDPDLINVTIGNDNPMFDFRGRHDPGGVGYTRVDSQVQLFDTADTALSLGLQAVTPAGLASNGLPDNRGVTVVTPGLCLYHELDEGLGFQAYIGKQMPLANSRSQPIHRDLRYAFAVHRPITTNQSDVLSNLYLSLGALARQRLEGDGSGIINWDVMPGLHLRLAENWWLSSGIILPVSGTRSDNAGLWRLTCQCQF